MNYTGEGSREAFLTQWEKWQGVMAHIRKQAPPNGEAIIQSSKTWNSVAMEVISLHTAVFAISICILLAVVLLVTFSSSVRLALTGVFTTLLTVALVFGAMCLLRMSVGSVETIALTGAVGMLASMNMHMIEVFLSLCPCPLPPPVLALPLSPCPPPPPPRPPRPEVLLATDHPQGCPPPPFPSPPHTHPVSGPDCHSVPIRHQRPQHAAAPDLRSREWAF